MRSRQNHKLFTVYSTTVTTLTYFSYVIHAMTSSVTHVPALYAYFKWKMLSFFSVQITFVLGRFIMDAMPRKFKAEQILIQNVIPRTQRKPENSVLQCNETHDVKLVVAVIP